jgi:cation-transporting ATPase 13A3/4/5
MSIIVKDVNNENDKSFRLHVKGAPEKLRELCLNSSIPPNFHKVLDFYAKVFIS